MHDGDVRPVRPSSAASIKAKLSNLWGALRPPSSVYGGDHSVGAHTRSRSDPDSLVGRSARSVCGTFSRIPYASVSECSASLDRTSPVSRIGCWSAKLLRSAGGSVPSGHLQPQPLGPYALVFSIDAVASSTTDIATVPPAATTDTAAATDTASAPVAPTVDLLHHLGSAGAALSGACTACGHVAACTQQVHARDEVAHAPRRAASTGGGDGRSRRATGLTYRAAPRRYASAHHCIASLSLQVLSGAPYTLTRSPCSASFPTASRSSPSNLVSAIRPHHLPFPPSSPPSSPRPQPLHGPTIAAVLNEHSVLRSEAAKLRDRLLLAHAPSLPSLPQARDTSCSRAAGMGMSTLPRP
ncbi:hypothetical protein FOA52_008724 [Chlamydomonas sp. UWO 241]|nr:hypothetical protein FOA52_008724 [Chlamydomonas sp. UWO 241]